MCRLLLLTLAAAATMVGAAPAHPNIIFVLTDDLGWGDVGVFFQNARRDSGDRALPYHLTPNLDRMSADGVRLTDHYVAAPVCAPSRASLLQGVTQGHANVRDNQFDKAIDDNHTLATVLRQAGYATAIIGKWGLHGQPAHYPGGGADPDAPAHPLNRGFDYFFGYLRHVDGHEHYPKEELYFKVNERERGPTYVWENRTNVTAALDKCYTADLWTARAKQWITDQVGRGPDKPFFLYLAYDTPHVVLELPTQAYPKGGGAHGGMRWLGDAGHMINTASGQIDSWIHPDYANATYDDDHDPATPEKAWPDVYRRYATSVRRIDDGLGDLLQLLKDLRIDDNTLVVFTSDNGPEIVSFLPGQKYTPEFFASFGPFDGVKRDCWEAGIRVPTIARWPGRIPAGRVDSSPSGTWDWLPTLAEIAGLPAPARADGISLWPRLAGQGAGAPRDALYFEYFVNGRTPNYPVFAPEHRGRVRAQMQAIRRGDNVAVRYDIKSADDDFEIYDVATDPKEAHNLAREPGYAARQAEFKRMALWARRPDAGARRPYDSALVPAVDGGKLRPGLEWRGYEGDYPWVPNFAKLTAVARGSAELPDPRYLRRTHDAGLYFTGYLRVPADGEYTFSLRTDTGAELRLHDATIIDADFGYHGGSMRTAKVQLQAGLHPLRLSYRRGSAGAPLLSLTWRGPDFPDQPIPAAAFLRDESSE